MRNATDTRDTHTNPDNTIVHGKQLDHPDVPGGPPGVQSRMGGILQSVRDIAGRLMPRREELPHAPPSKRPDLERLEGRVVPATVIERYTDSVSHTFSTVTPGDLPDNTQITLPDVGTGNVSRGGFTPIRVTTEGTLRTGENQGHLCLSFTEPRMIESVTLRHVSGSTGGLLHLGDGYIPLGEGTQTITVNKAIPYINVVVLSASMTYEIMGYTVKKEMERTIEVPDTPVSTALATLQGERATAQAAMDDLVAHPVTVSEQRTVHPAANFSGIPAGDKANGTVLSVQHIGNVTVSSGGFTPVRVTAEGALRTGVNQGHLIAGLPEGTFVESITVKHTGGSGRAMIYLNGYIDITQETQTFPVNRILDGFAVVIYNTAEYEVSAVNVRRTEMVQIPTPAYLASVQAAQTRITQLNTDVAELERLWKEEKDAFIADTHETQTQEPVRLMIGSVNVDTPSLQNVTVHTTPRRAEATVSLGNIGGTMRIASWQGKLKADAGMDGAADQHNGTLTLTGNATGLDFSDAGHLVTEVRLHIASEQAGAMINVITMRGDTRTSVRQVQSGQSVTLTDAAGITGVILESTEKPMSQEVRDFLAYFNSAEGQYQAGRAAWEWWNQNGYKSFPEFGGASIAYFAGKNVPDSQKWSILAQAAAGRTAYTLQVSQLEVEADTSLPQAEADPLEETGMGLLYTAPDWKESGNWQQALTNNNASVYLQNRGTSQSPDFKVASFSPNEQQYHLYVLRSSGGALQLGDVRYITESGLQALPQEYWEVAGTNAFILKPGAPKHIVVQAGFTDGRPGGGPFEVIVGKSGQETSEVTPVQGTRLNGSVLQVYAQTGAEGFGNEVTEVPAGASAVMISDVRMLMNLRNIGIGSGAVTIKIRSGWNGTLADPVVKQFQTSVLGLESKSLSFNVSPPSTPNPGTETNPRQPQVTITATGADGVEYVVSERAGRLPQENPAQTQAQMRARIAALLNAQSQLPMYGTDGITIIGMGGKLFSDHATMAALDTGIGGSSKTDAIQSLPLAIDFGKQENWSPATLPLLARRAMQLYNPVYGAPPGISSSEVALLQKTAVGQLFLGIAQRSVFATTEIELSNLALMVRAATGIDQNKVLTYLRAAPDASGRPVELRKLFNPSAGSSSAADPTLRSAFQEDFCAEEDVVTHVSAKLNGSTVRIRFNYNSDDFRYDRGNVYVMNALGQQIGTLKLVPDDFRHQLYIDVSTERIADALRAIYGHVPNIDNLRFKVALWTQAGDVPGLQGFNVTPEAINIDLQAKNLSTLPESDPRARTENAILTQISKQPFLNLSAGTWRWDIGSGLHRDTDTNHAYHAADLNLGSGNEDQGQPIYAVANGKVHKNFIDSGGNTTLVIEYMLDLDGDGETETKWYMKHLHVQRNGYSGEGSALPQFNIGDAVTAGMQICEVGRQSNDASMKAHDHVEVLDSLMQSIDLRRLLTEQFHVTVRATNERDEVCDVTWDTSVNAWVATKHLLTQNNPYLIYDRSSQQNGGSESRWLAWHEDPAQRFMVVWVHQLQDGRVVDAWLKADDHSKKWNPTTRQWETL